MSLNGSSNSISFLFFSTPVKYVSSGLRGNICVHDVLGENVFAHNEGACVICGICGTKISGVNFDRRHDAFDCDARRLRRLGHFDVHSQVHIDGKSKKI